MGRGIARGLALASFAAAAWGQEIDARVEEAVALYRRAEESELRAEQLASLAALGGAEAPAEQRARVARALADALDDDSHRVRGAAIELLAASPEREIALPALVTCARRHQRELAAFWKEHWKLVGRMGAGRSSGSGGAELEDLLKDLRRMKAGSDAVQEHLDANEGLVELSTTLRDAFASVRDDRSVDGLEVVLAGQATGSWSEPAHAALLAIGTDAAVALAVAAFDEHEEARKELSRELTQRERERPQRAPSSWKGTRDEWEAAERERLEKRCAPVRERLAALDAWALAHRELLARFAEEMQLSAPPAEPLPYVSWRSWLAEARELLPDSLSG